MKKVLTRLSAGFSGGALGGLANSLAVWGLGAAGISTALGANLTPAWSWPWLYPRIVWGGLWGLLFAFPCLQGSWLARGLLYSLGPSLVQMLIVFPLKAEKGLLGLDLGATVPPFVLFYNAIWGVVAAVWVTHAVEKSALAQEGSEQQT